MFWAFTDFEGGVPPRLRACTYHHENVVHPRGGPDPRCAAFKNYLLQMFTSCNYFNHGVSVKSDPR